MRRPRKELQSPAGRTEAFVDQILPGTIRERAGGTIEKRQHRDPRRLHLIGHKQCAALFFSLHLGQISPRPNEARAFRGKVRSPRLRFHRLIAQVAHVAPHGVDQVILPSLRLRDHPFRGLAVEAAAR